MNTFLAGFLVGILLGVLAGIFISGLMTIYKVSAYRERIAQLEEEATRIEFEYGDIIVKGKEDG